MSRRPAPRWHFGEPLASLATLLAAGGVVAIPTESSYGLAALPGSVAGVESVYRVKSRDRGKPLPVVIAHREQLRGLGLDPEHPVLAAVAGWWPGPLTVALPFAAPDASRPAAAAGGDSLAVRIPGHAGLRELLAALGHGLTATSANRSGGEPILDPDEVAWLLADEPRALVVDGGLLSGGPPSTLIAPVAAAGGALAVRVLRQGAVSAAQLRRELEVAD